MRITQKLSSYRGFTLIELLVVIAVIGVITGVVLSNYGNWQKQIATTKIKSDLAGAVSSLENYRNYNNAYPSSIPSDFTKTDNDITLSGGSMDGGDTFCLVATSTKLSGVTYYVDSSNKTPHTSPSCVSNATVLSSSKNINADPLLKTARTCADGINYSVTALSANTATLSSSPTAACLTNGDEVLLINLSGTSSNYTNVGNYETRIVQSIAGSVITFTGNKTKYYGNGASDDTNIGISSGNQRVMLQRIPTYSSFAINSGVTLTSSAWNGVKGGVIYLKVTGTLTIDGTITVDRLGYRGASGGYWFGGAGESRNGGPLIPDPPSCTSGSCSLAQNANDGGGGGAGSNHLVDSQTGGAGGAAHASNGANGGTGRYSPTFGYGGAAYGATNLSKIHFGSGGGGNATIEGSNSPGGNGGGVIIISCSSLVINSTGSVSAAGGAGVMVVQESSGGAGGSIYIMTTDASIGTNKVTAAAGASGNSHAWSPPTYLTGGSGQSSPGRIRITGSVTGTSSPTFNP